MTSGGQQDRRETELSRLDSSRLEALLESAQLLHSSLNLDELLRHLLRTAMGRLLVSRGLIAVSDEEGMRLALVRGVGALKAGSLFDEAHARRAGIELILKIGDDDNPVGLLGLGRPASGSVDEREIEFLKALLGIAASGIENARSHDVAQRLNLALDQKVQELMTLLDLVRGLNSTLEPDDIARLLVLTLAGRWAVRRYAIQAWKTGHPTVRRHKGIELPELNVYVDELASVPDGVFVSQLPDGELKSQLAAQDARVLLVLRSQETIGGAVVLGPRPGKLEFSQNDLEFGSGLVTQAIVSLENSWYFREAIERKKIEQELKLAATIQENLFPAKMPDLERYELAARNRPARQCGGDYYDALPVGLAGADRPYLVCVADVSGKGLPASLLMSNIQATLRALLGRTTSLVELAWDTNELLYATTPSSKYVTAILVEIDPVSGKARYVNAGHTSSLLLRSNGEAIWLTATGTPLGLMSGLPYEEGGLQLEKGDLLALFSDGVTEAQDEGENEYGEERLAELLRPIAQLPANAIVDRVFEDIDRFAGAAPQYDDITLMVLKRN
jgi:sigma-B regulation protein RsbU (phosphoserine phosphatase)